VAVQPLSGVMEMSLLKLKLILQVSVDTHDFSEAGMFHQLYFLRKKLFIPAISAISTATAIVSWEV
jgi:hypothetical protein